MDRPKIVFVVPPFVERNLYKKKDWPDGGQPRRDGKQKDLRVYPSLGVGYLIAALERSNPRQCAIELIDAAASNLTIDELVNEIIDRKPDILAITMVTFTLHATFRIVNACKEKLPALIVILGGVHLNHSPDDFRYFNADYALRGDCEFTLPELVAAILEKRDPGTIPGIVYKTAGAERLVINDPASVDNLDDLAFPDRSRLVPEHYVFYLFDKKFATIVGSRGCPFKCIYCGLPYNDRYKARSVQNIVAEMETVRAQGYEYISFCDDVFTLNQKRTRALCDLIREKKISLPWGCATRADCVDADLFINMKAAGCVDVRFGVESGNEQVRGEIINKRISNQRYLQAVQWAKRAGLVTTGYFIFGQPGETYEQMRETVGFAKQLDLDYAYFGISMIIPNSVLCDHALKEGRIDNELWHDIILGEKEIPFYCPDGVTLERMMALRAYAHRSFYLRPRYLWNQLKSIRSIDDCRFKLNMGLRFLHNSGRK